MIICMDGFSPDVRKQAKKDGVDLVGPEDLEQVFEESTGIGLIKKLRELRGLKTTYPALPWDLKSDLTLSKVSGSDLSEVRSRM